MTWTETHTPVAISTRTDLPYPYEIRFSFFVPGASTKTAYQAGRQVGNLWLRQETHLVHDPVERMRVYLAVLRREHAGGWFELQNDRFHAARAYEQSRDAYRAQAQLATGGNVNSRIKNQPRYIHHDFKDEFDLRLARYGLKLKEDLEARILLPDAELLVEKIEYQIVNEYYATMAEQLIQRKHFSRIQVKDPALHPPRKE